MSPSEAEERMADPSTYFKRVMEFPGIVRRPEDAKFEALAEIGARALVEKETRFQRILLVETPKNELMLLLDGELQFYSGDEHRYHECLTLVPFLFAERPVRSVGIMGGGDGLVARELLRHYGREIETIRVVDIDPAVTELGRTEPRLLELNRGSLLDDRVEVVNADALSYRSAEPFDLIVCDLPDPASSLLGRLYNREFYEHLRAQLTPETGLLVAQVVYAPPFFDGVLTTMRTVFPALKEYAVWMYSFVRSGFALCGQLPLERCRELPDGTRYLSREVVDGLFYFPSDEPRAEISEASTEQNQLAAKWYGSYLRDHVEERILYY